MIKYKDKIFTLTTLIGFLMLSSAFGNKNDSVQKRINNRKQDIELIQANLDAQLNAKIKKLITNNNMPAIQAAIFDEPHMLINKQNINPRDIESISAYTGAQVANIFWQSSGVGFINKDGKPTTKEDEYVRLESVVEIGEILILIKDLVNQIKVCHAIGKGLLNKFSEEKCMFQKWLNAVYKNKRKWNDTPNDTAATSNRAAIKWSEQDILDDEDFAKVMTYLNEYMEVAKSYIEILNLAIQYGKLSEEKMCLGINENQSSIK